MSGRGFVDFFVIFRNKFHGKVLNLKKPMHLKDYLIKLIILDEILCCTSFKFGKAFYLFVWEKFDI
jgi:hypothetical protein